MPEPKEPHEKFAQTTNGLVVQYPHIEEKYAPAEKVQVRFELVGDYVSIGLGEPGDGVSYRETTGTMIGIEQFANAAAMFLDEYRNQVARRRKENTDA